MSKGRVERVRTSGGARTRDQTCCKFLHKKATLYLVSLDPGSEESQYTNQLRPSVSSLLEIRKWHVNNISYNISILVRSPIDQKWNMFQLMISIETFLCVCSVGKGYATYMSTEANMKSS